MRIMLACNAGMSTSLVVAKMQDAAKAQGKDYKIWAVEQGEIQNELGNFDVLLLGPQVRYLEKEYKPLCEQKGKGFGVIPMQTYGRMDGKGCMELARKAFADK